MKFSFPATALLSVALAGLAAAQQVGTLTAETHPKLTWAKCTKAAGCTNVSASIVLDANWRWLHSTAGATNCYDGNTWNTALCPNEATCSANCAVDGADYSGTYGVTTSGNAINHQFVKVGPYSTNIGSRVYLMDSSDSKYEMFYPLNKEFTFDADTSKLVCGLNGALYFVEMDSDGGLKYPTNKAGAKYGTGYCDAQCPHDIKFINGKANVEGWNPSGSDANAGSGRYGTCCPEMDIWEANNISQAYTPHACSTPPGGAYRCDALECGDGDDRYKGVCDKDGCDINPYRMGNKNFYGPGSGFTLDTSKKVTVVTQFITSDGTANGDLVEIRRKYVQNGIIYETPKINISGIPATNSITDAYCAVQKSVFGDPNDHLVKGGLKAMGASLKRGHVLVMSIWADHAVQMKWLDSNWPENVPSTNPGVARGTCPGTGSNPDDIVKNNPNATVQYSNIRFGELDSTYSGTPANPGTGTTTTASVSVVTSTKTSSASTTSKPTSITTTTKSTSTTSTTSTKPVTTTAAPSGGSIGKWQQCGGINWSGSGTCVSGSTCQVINPYYHQCL